MNDTKGKVCKKCGIWKPLSEYNKHHTNRDGLTGECKDCKRTYDTQKWLNHKEYYRRKMKIRKKMTAKNGASK